MINSKNKKIGLRWIIIPIVSLVIILIIYTVTDFIVNQIPQEAHGDILRMAPSPNSMAGVIFISLVFLGMINVVFVFVGLIIGIIYLLKKDKLDKVIFISKTNKGDKSLGH
jgi:capsular polysaccharide biosynthesis protein